MKGHHIELSVAEGDSVLYHYTKSNGINGIINNNCFWATKNDFLNDPDEFIYIRSIIADVCNTRIKDESYRQMFLKDVLEDTLIDQISKEKEYFVLCFSTCRDSITMWSEFGNKTGYNLGLESASIVKRIENAADVEYHGFVVYSKAKQRELILGIMDEYITKYFSKSFDEILELGFNDPNSRIYLEACEIFRQISTVYAMFFKNEAFSEEQEYRFVFRKNRSTVVYFREKDGFLIPYIKIQLSQEHLPVRELVVAPQNHIDLAKKGMEYMLTYKGYDVPVHLSKIKLRY
jgi:hypothetical protein